MLSTDAADVACVNWFRERGGKAPKIAPAIFPDTGRGMIALDDIEADEVLVEVPEEMLLTTRSAAQGDLGDVLHDVDPTTALCLHLLHERSLGEKSGWFPFIRMLPPVYDTMMYFSKDDLDALQDDKAALEARNAQELLRKMYADVQPLMAEHAKLFPPAAFTFELFQTRACYMKVNSAKGDTSCLVPVADYLNHSNVETDAGFDASAHCYRITTKSPFKRGEQVFISYGKHGNIALLNLYGFVIPHNIEDIVLLDEAYVSAMLASIEQDPALRAAKLKMIEELPLTRNYFAKWREISWNVMAIARIMHMRADELDSDNVFAAVFEEREQLLFHEAPVADFVRGLIHSVLSRYPTTVQQDEALLHSSSSNAAGLSYRQRCAVLLRLEQKRVLLSCLETLPPHAT